MEAAIISWKLSRNEDLDPFPPNERKFKRQIRRKNPTPGSCFRVKFMEVMKAPIQTLMKVASMEVASVKESSRASVQNLLRSNFDRRFHTSCRRNADESWNKT